MKNNSPLLNIAQVMAQYAIRNPLAEPKPEQLPTGYRHRLPRGLRLALWAGPQLWHLSLTRDRTPPSQKELDIVRRAFGVPSGTYAYGPIPRAIKTKTFFTFNLSWPHKLTLATKTPGAPAQSVPK